MTKKIGKSFSKGFHKFLKENQAILAAIILLIKAIIEHTSKYLFSAPY